ncbi:MAG TPA: hypothetical protein VGN36_08260, partial [Sphingorhabdus sp.]|nr:hypothetical protein [Sphingorhabdus sp.]
FTLWGKFEAPQGPDGKPSGPWKLVSTYITMDTPCASPDFDQAIRFNDIALPSGMEVDDINAVKAKALRDINKRMREACGKSQSSTECIGLRRLYLAFTSKMPGLPVATGNATIGRNPAWGLVDGLKLASCAWGIGGAIKAGMAALVSAQGAGNAAFAAFGCFPSE